ncbi:MAG: S8 family serine peptidase, partial [Candidatus Thermoplasmatota archaeon]|nr:S8 family serine peptidase [Candidatus Thermoplasmatota archaeon]
MDFADSETLSILKLKKNNGELIKGLSEEYGFIPLDRISTNVWMIKKVSSDESFSKLEHDDKVRWVNNLPIGWKLHPLLNLEDPLNSLTLITVLSPDIDLVNLELLKIKLIESGMEIISCDLMDCVVKLGKFPKSDLGTLLTDDRIVWIEPRISYVLTNAQAGEQSGIQSLLNNWNSGLNGSGETVSIVDTGLDMDHSDYASQLIAVQNGFGLDNNPSDSISGHGTHVTGTLLGDGSGESEAFGIAPAATLHMYQLENNQQGVIGRIGSIYNLMQDAYDNSARFQSTSWVSENAGGQYNSDSQSVDKFLWKNRDFTAIYSAGNNGSNGINT